MARRHHIPHVLLLVDTAGAFGRGIVEGIGRYALEHGPWSIQFEYRALDSSVPEWLKQWRGDGIISRTANPEQVRLLQTLKRPLVELLGQPASGIPEVGTDNAAEANMAVQHFLDCGLRHFGFYPCLDVWPIREHRLGFCRALEARGYTCSVYELPERERETPVRRGRGQSSFVKWLRCLPRPTGVFTPGDLHSARLLAICRELDIAVPEEIAILGIGNDPVICETVRPTLSSLDVDTRRIGFEAARLLARKMAGRVVKDPVFVPPSHVAIRQSTDLMAIEDADIAQAVRFIRERACQDIDVSRVAEEVGLSRRVLEKRFFQYVGRAPMAEIRRLRIEHAKALLARTDQTSESIARKCCFSSVPSLTKAFRREVGTTPNAYRKMQRISRD